jgi:squalene-hopene/tetraprenyl-beta-curcumene cyclase
MMFAALGIPQSDPRRAVARRSVEKLLVVHAHEAYCQPCVSPIWDTSLVCHTLLDVGGERAVAQARKGLDWLVPMQILDVRGDWIARRPNLRPGGWAFQYANPHYPDVDDTAVVALAMDRFQKISRRDDYREALARSLEWIIGMQSKNGGWGAFDADNEYYYLNNIPFADHGALLDPPTEDVTARCLSMLTQLRQNILPRAAGEGDHAEHGGGGVGVNGVIASEAKQSSLGVQETGLLRHYAPRNDGRPTPLPPPFGRSPSPVALRSTGEDETAVARAIDYLRRTQRADGSWYGRWGMNYIYGTWSVLCALNAAGVNHAAPEMRKAVDWLASIQNQDGGWGEDGSSYKLDYRGYERAPSTASQTAWALLGLMAAGATDHPALARGIAYLTAMQGADGFWNEPRYTATGFPRVFYLRYHGYAKFFPLWALARYRNLRSGNERVMVYGM